MFTNRHLGIILLITGILVISLALGAKAKEDFYIDALITQHGGECIIENNYCLHNDRNWTGYIIAWALGVSLILFGAYLAFVDRSYALFREERERFSQELARANEHDTFTAYLAGFTTDEQTVLKAIKEQDGITQATLRYRTGMSKAGLSHLLQALEERDVIARKPVGKTKQVYLRKRF